MTGYGMLATTIATLSAVAYIRFTASKIMKSGKTNSMTEMERLRYCILRGTPITAVLIVVIWIIAWIDK